MTKILNTPQMREKLAAQGAEANPMTPAAFATFIANEVP